MHPLDVNLYFIWNSLSATTTLIDYRSVAVTSRLARPMMLMKLAYVSNRTFLVKNNSIAIESFLSQNILEDEVEYGV